jgi:hypothetical protein
MCVPLVCLCLNALLAAPAHFTSDPVSQTACFITKPCVQAWHGWTSPSWTEQRLGKATQTHHHVWCLDLCLASILTSLSSQSLLQSGVLCVLHNTFNGQQLNLGSEPANYDRAHESDRTVLCSRKSMELQHNKPGSQLPIPAQVSWVTLNSPEGYH